MGYSSLCYRVEGPLWAKLPCWEHRGIGETAGKTAGTCGKPLEPRETAGEPRNQWNNSNSLRADPAPMRHAALSPRLAEASLAEGSLAGGARVRTLTAACPGSNNRPQSGSTRRGNFDGIDTRTHLDQGTHFRSYWISHSSLTVPLLRIHCFKHLPSMEFDKQRQVKSRA